VRTGASRGQLTERLTSLSTPVTVAFSPDGSALASSNFFVTEVWDVASRQVRQRLDDQSVAIAKVAFSPDGRSVAGVGTVSDSSRIFVWKTP